MKKFLAFFYLILLSGLLYAQNSTNDWNDVSLEQVDTALLDPLSAKLMKDPAFHWLHAQTDHFVIHYEKKIFAAKVARQAEFFYDFIGQDLKSANDRMTNRSHIFIFRDDKDNSVIDSFSANLPFLSKTN